MRYREFRPDPRVASIVDRVWTLDGDASEEDRAPQPVLPDGCPEIVLHLGDPFHRIDASGAAAQPRLIFAGQILSPITLQQGRRVAVVGIRLHPYAAGALLPQPQHELAGLTVDLGGLSRELAGSLIAVAERTDDVTAAAGLVQDALRTRVTPAIDPRIHAAVNWISRRRGQVSMEAIAQAVNLTRRHLERRFLQTVGLSPKRLARITRFQHALRLLERTDTGRRATDTAAACGYADQAHFTRDFRSLAGCSPSEHLLQRAELTGFFLGSARRA